MRSSRFPVSFILLVTALLFSAASLIVEVKRTEAAGIGGVYSGSDTLLHLEEGTGGDVRGVFFTRDAAYRFEAEKKGGRYDASSLWARQGRSSPYRRIAGRLGFITDGEDRIQLEALTAGRSFSTVLRAGISAKTYSVLDGYGDRYCDGRNLVLLVPDEPPEETGDLMARLRGEKKESPMPLLGMYFGSDVWFSFRASGSIQTGITSSDLSVGGGALEGYLGDATLQARLDGGRLDISYRDRAGEHRFLLSSGGRARACAGIVTRWTARRRGTAGMEGTTMPAKPTQARPGSPPGAPGGAASGRPEVKKPASEAGEPPVRQERPAPRAIPPKPPVSAGKGPGMEKKPVKPAAEQPEGTVYEEIPPEAEKPADAVDAMEGQAMEEEPVAPMEEEIPEEAPMGGETEEGGG